MQVHKWNEATGAAFAFKRVRKKSFTFVTLRDRT